MRAQNEDAFRVAAGDPLVAVADGMGGHAAGAVASALAVAALVEFFDDARRVDIAAGRADVCALLVDAFQAAHCRVREAGAADEACAGMGTTLLAAWIDGDRLVTCHVGDVRCYVHGAGGLYPMTEDHSVIGELVRAGQLTLDEARRHPQRNEILQAIGGDSALAADVNTLVLAPGDRVLFCSDGLWGELSDDEIAAIVAGDGSVAERAVRLVDRALAAGGGDNVTVILYEQTLGGESACSGEYCAG